MSPFSRTPRTVLGTLVPGVLNPGAATRILCVILAREAGSLRDLAMWVRPEATERPRTFALVERGLRTLAPCQRSSSHDHVNPVGPVRRKLASGITRSS
ncbi:hypothetical protein GCM10010383_49500 [Streptomyces lomondensis]|uniref:Transposase n=1 Tax=Streptomyces lomondensis TaxID=68229 RepID=A0ABQ2XEF5_9ACTN|nr:hypothetical protein GCM10010383_49500 [Streptomyces lomondensis]